MQRLIYQQLLVWKNSPDRKPLLLHGARQVGKTYTLKEFAEGEYNNWVEFNFEEDPDITDLFEGKLEPKVLIESLSLYKGKKIAPGTTLVFFDEIQAAPRAITSLKYFCEKAPEYHIVAAGSLLGVSVGKQSGFPVGKVNFLDMYPMNFLECLQADNEEMLVDYLINKIDFSAIPDVVHEKLLTKLKRYLFLGGMPEVVAHYLSHQDVRKARNIQLEILKSYESDFSKYSTPDDAIRISNLWNSIPSQLTRENKKFKYRDIAKNARSSFYEVPIEWLRKAGLVHLSYNVKNPKLPLNGYFEQNKFKLFVLDSGLLGAMLKVPSQIIVKGDQLFSEYNGAFIENYVAIEWTAQALEPLCYWTSNSDAEVDFLCHANDGILPVEVKSGYSRRMNSMRVYVEKYKPLRFFRISPRNFTQDNNFYNIPLYATSMMNTWFA